MNQKPRFIVVTGLSGAGKSFTAKCFEDMGYYCVDNLPLQLIPVFCDLITRSSGISQVALVVDVREGAFLAGFPEVLSRLRAEGRDVSVLFLESSDEVLIRRFSETRRPHPLSRDSAADGIRKEREVLAPVRDRANKIIDTSKFNVHELRAYLLDNFHAPDRQETIFVSMISFGYKYGVPVDSDMVFDVRFLPNPHFQEELRGKSGLDAEVAAFMESAGDYREYYAKVKDLLIFLMPRFVKEGKTYVTISIGCTGGRHRSVAMAQQLGEDLGRAGYRVRTVHRDMARG
jgi:UPF0042 nucleotide-binding protein